MAMAEDILTLRETTRDALETHIAKMLDNTTSAKEAKDILERIPLELNVARAYTRDLINYRDWSITPKPVVIETDFDSLVRDFHAARLAPLTNVVETAPNEDRIYTVLKGLKSLGMFSTIENAKAAQACGEAGWDIYQKLDHDAAGSSYAVVYPSENPFVSKVEATLAEVLPALSEKSSVFVRI